PLSPDARAAARPADRRRPARDGLLLRARAREGQGDARDVRRRRVRDAPARLPLTSALRGRADLPRRRPRRPGDPDLAAAHRRPAGDRRDRRDPRRGARGGVGAGGVTSQAEARIAPGSVRKASQPLPVDITLERVTKRFDDVVAVDELSLEIEQGSFFALLGPSGCGKTTTLRMIGGFEQPTEGQIYLGEREVSGLPAYKRDVNTVFQSYALFPHLSVFENVAFGLRRPGARCER